jgi:hypothetical protein
VTVVLNVGYVIPSSTGILDLRITLSTRPGSPTCALRWDDRLAVALSGSIDIEVPNVRVLSSLTHEDAAEGLIAAIRCGERFGGAGGGATLRQPIAIVYSDRKSWRLAEHLSAAMCTRLAPLPLNSANQETRPSAATPRSMSLRSLK